MDNILNRYVRDKMPDVLVEKARNEANQMNKTEISVSEQAADLITLLERINGLNVDSALNAMSGMTDVYLDTVKLTLKLLPVRINKMDIYINTEIKSFTNEVHGLKSALRNIGAEALGDKAASLERAALEDNIQYCHETYPLFRDGLAELTDNLNGVLSVQNIAEIKEAADVSSLISVLSDAKTAAEGFDRDEALNIIKPYMDYTYGTETDELIKDIVFALELFDCENALQKLIILEEALK
jgi:HPt (histidine-containing phosphotransfer) domain-containing protein